MPRFISRLLPIVLTAFAAIPMAGCQTPRASPGPPSAITACPTRTVPRSASTTTSSRTTPRAVTISRVTAAGPYQSSPPLTGGSGSSSIPTTATARATTTTSGSSTRSHSARPTASPGRANLPTTTRPASRASPTDATSGRDIPHVHRQHHRRCRLVDRRVGPGRHLPRLRGRHRPRRRRPRAFELAKIDPDQPLESDVDGFAFDWSGGGGWPRRTCCPRSAASHLRRRHAQAAGPATSRRRSQRRWR